MFSLFGFKIEEQHKKALEEDPSIFDYDGVYDKMKLKIAQPREQDHEERKVLLLHGTHFEKGTWLCVECLISKL